MGFEEREAHSMATEDSIPVDFTPAEWVLVCVVLHFHLFLTVHRHSLILSRLVLSL